MPEDELLRELVHTHGACNWPFIASLVKDREAKQCRERYGVFGIVLASWLPLMPFCVDSASPPKLQLLLLLARTRDSF